MDKNEIDKVLREVRVTRGEIISLFTSYPQELSIADIDRYIEIIFSLYDQIIILDSLSNQNEDSHASNSINTERNFISKSISQIIQTLKARTFQYLDSIQYDILSKIITVVSLNNYDSRHNDFLMAVITERHIRIQRGISNKSLFFSKLAVWISAMAFLVVAIFSVLDNFGDKTWQKDQIAKLSDINSSINSINDKNELQKQAIILEEQTEILQEIKNIIPGTVKE